MKNSSRKKIVLTMDTDWCPPYVLSYALSIFKDLPVTIFATNHYPSKIFGDNHEIGIHPNLEGLKNLSENSLNSIFDPLTKIYPETRCCRTHKLIWFSSLDQYLFSRNITVDSSIQIYNNYPMAGISPSGLVRYPILWSDGLYINNRIEILPKNILFPHNIISVHPIHIWLNTSNIIEYNTFKKEVPQLEIASSNLMDKYFRMGSKKSYGIRNLIVNFINSIDHSLFSLFPNSL